MIAEGFEGPVDHRISRDLQLCAGDGPCKRVAERRGPLPETGVGPVDNDGAPGACQLCESERMGVRISVNATADARSMVALYDPSEITAMIRWKAAASVRVHCHQNTTPRRRNLLRGVCFGGWYRD